MIRQVLEVFFLAQVVSETLCEKSQEALKGATDQLHQFLSSAKTESEAATTRIEAAAETTAKDYQKVVDSIKELATNVGVLIRESAKLPVPQLISALPTLAEKVTKTAV